VPDEAAAWKVQALKLAALRSARDGALWAVRMALPQLVERVAAYARPDLPPERRLFPLAYTRFSSMWKKAVRRAGLLDAAIDGRGQLVALTPHDLRRVYALFARRAGLSRETIGLAGLGHDNLATTERYIRSLTSVSADEAAAVASEIGL
jgi:integrase